MYAQKHLKNEDTLFPHKSWYKSIFQQYHAKLGYSGNGLDTAYIVLGIRMICVGFRKISKSLLSRKSDGIMRQMINH